MKTVSINEDANTVHIIPNELQDRLDRKINTHTADDRARSRMELYAEQAPVSLFNSGWKKPSTETLTDVAAAPAPVSSAQSLTSIFNKPAMQAPTNGQTPKSKQAPDLKKSKLYQRRQQYRMQQARAAKAAPASKSSVQSLTSIFNKPTMQAPTNGQTPKLKLALNLKKSKLYQRRQQHRIRKFLAAQAAQPSVSS